MANKSYGGEKKGGGIVRAIVLILVALVLLLVIGFVYKFTNGGNEDFKTFYMTYEEKDILTANSSMVLPDEKEHRFDVKYTFDLPNAEPREYNVKIVVNTKADFTYTVDGEVHAWRDEGDITAAFDLTKEASFFTISIPEDMTVESVLQRLHEDKEIQAPLYEELENPFIFTLIVSSYNEGVTYHINFTSFVTVTDVTLNEELITV